VEALKAAAPPIEGWEIIAFKPRVTLTDGESLRYRGTSLRVSDAWFQAHETDKGLAFVFAAAKVDGRRENEAFGTCVLLMDSLLGELAAMTYVIHAEFTWLPQDPVAEHFRPLSRLADFVDSWAADR
jgi:hypothetical protein